MSTEFGRCKGKIPLVNVIYRGDNLKVLSSRKYFPDGFQCDGVITSPPYNLGKNPNHRRKSQSDYSFYSAYDDAKTPEQYMHAMIQLFQKLQRLVKPTGVVLFNMSYCSKSASLPYRVVVEIEKNTKWRIRDTIFWKKRNAMPFQSSPRNLSRITEMIFVFSQKEKFDTNKQVKSINERTQQKFYENITNFIEAPSHDGRETRKHHKATFSCSLVEQLIEIYFSQGSVILDPFSGMGTTGVACIRKRMKYILIEIDPKYAKLSEKRLNKME